MPGGDVGRDLDHPGVAVGNQLVGTPDARCAGTVDQANLVDLEELKVSLLDSLTAGTAAAGEVVDDGAVMRVGPSVPLDEDLVAGRNDGMASSVGRVLVADDVAAVKGIGGDEAVVRVAGGPANNRRRVLHVREAGRVIVLVRDAVDDNVCDVAMGRNRHRTRKGGNEGLGGERRHLRGWFVVIEKRSCA